MASLEDKLINEDWKLINAKYRGLIGTFLDKRISLNGYTTAKDLVRAYREYFHESLVPLLGTKLLLTKLTELVDALNQQILYHAYVFGMPIEELYPGEMLFKTNLGKRILKNLANNPEHPVVPDLRLFPDQVLWASLQSKGIKGTKFVSKKTMVTRETVGKTCDWCIGKAGVYTIQEATSQKIFARHASCDCEIVVHRIYQ